MRLFDETENIYYELIAYLLLEQDGFSSEKLRKLLSQYMDEEIDFEVVDTLFSKIEGNELLFTYKDATFWPILEGKFPIRANDIEKEAMKSIQKQKYTPFFLTDSTLNKIKEATKEIKEDWDIDDIYIKNQFLGGIAKKVEKYRQSLTVIAKSIVNKTAIECDNVKVGVYEYHKQIVFPVKIEYSFINDQFRICVYEPKEGRFIKMNLETMEYISSLPLTSNINILEEYQDFLKNHRKKLILDVEAIDHAIERCFRIFSYYDRDAIYSEKENCYRLEITYLDFDENEVIRDILSLGSSVIVIEPKELQKRIYDRILLASKQY